MAWASSSPTEPRWKIGKRWKQSSSSCKPRSRPPQLDARNARPQGSAAGRRAPTSLVSIRALTAEINHSNHHRPLEEAGGTPFPRARVSRKQIPKPPVGLASPDSDCTDFGCRSCRIQNSAYRSGCQYFFVFKYLWRSVELSVQNSVHFVGVILWDG